MPAIPVLWFGAHWFSSRIAPQAEVEHEKAPWTRAELMSLGIILAGLLIIMWALPSLFAAAYYYPREAAEDLFAEQLIFAVPQIILGLLCLLGPTTISHFLTAARRWDSDRSG